jgi:hypothetical protein
MPFDTEISSLPAQAEPSVAFAARKRSPARQRAYFLRQFERCGAVTEAAARTGITPRTVQRWRNNDPRFALRYEDALARRSELLEDDGIRRARGVTFKPYFYRGRHIASVEQHNDRLLMFMLNRLDRAQQRGVDASQLRAIAQATAAKLVEILRESRQQGS